MNYAIKMFVYYVLNYLKGPNRDATYIPGGLTRFFQPLDIVINKPFKENLR